MFTTLFRVIIIDGSKELDQVPSSHRRPKPKALEDYERQSKTRNEAIVAAYGSGGYTLKEVGEYFGLHYSTISRILANHKSKT
jgi:DNA-binding CsgD family transcriptional regulator